MKNHRIVTTFLFSGLMLLSAAFITRSLRSTDGSAWRLSPDIEKSRIDLTYNQFNVMKVSQPPVYDVVLGGHSRVECGVAPQVLARSLPGRQIFNYGFSAVVFTNTYLDALESLLKPSGSDRMIILGISPIALMTTDMDSNNFTSFYRLSKRQRFKIMETDQILSDFTPVDGKDQPGRYFHRDYYSNGWMGAEWKPTRHAFSFLRQRSIGNKLSPEVVQGVLDHVTQWSQQGIRVVAYWTPTTDEMWSLEDELSGLDRADFVQRFKKAGGTWLTFDNSRYQWPDSHHMNKKMAVSFSEDLGRALVALRDERPITVASKP